MLALFSQRIEKRMWILMLFVCEACLHSLGLLESDTGCHLYNTIPHRVRLVTAYFTQTTPVLASKSGGMVNGPCPR
jgi:hypothetical protein